MRNQKNNSLGFFIISIGDFINYFNRIEYCKTDYSLQKKILNGVFSKICPLSAPGEYIFIVHEIKIEKDQKIDIKLFDSTKKKRTDYKKPFYLFIYEKKNDKFIDMNNDNENNYFIDYKGTYTLVCLSVENIPERNYTLALYSNKSINTIEREVDQNYLPSLANKFLEHYKNEKKNLSNRLKNDKNISIYTLFFHKKMFFIFVENHGTVKKYVEFNIKESQTSLFVDSKLGHNIGGRKRPANKIITTSEGSLKMKTIIEPNKSKYIATCSCNFDMENFFKTHNLNKQDCFIQESEIEIFFESLIVDDVKNK